MFKSKDISRQAKVGLYKTVTVKYGSEVWVLTKAEETKLAVWERTILKRIWGGKKEGQIWPYQNPLLTEVVKAQSMRWLGHVLGMERTGTPRKVLESKLSGIRRRGRSVSVRKLREI